MQFRSEDILNILGGVKKEHNDEEETKIELKDKTSNETIAEVFKPVKTRRMLSLFEYTRIITELAKYLYSLSSIDKYVRDIEIHNVINPAELAFELLDQGKFDAVLDRGSEKVTYSTLMVNDIWRQTIRKYFKTQHENIYSELLQPLSIAE